jgi:hypothetical protein
VSASMRWLPSTANLADDALRGGGGRRQGAERRLARPVLRLRGKRQKGRKQAGGGEQEKTEGGQARGFQPRWVGKGAGH